MVLRSKNNQIWTPFDLKFKFFPKKKSIFVRISGLKIKISFFKLINGQTFGFNANICPNLVLRSRKPKIGHLLTWNPIFSQKSQFWSKFWFYKVKISGFKIKILILRSKYVQIWFWDQENQKCWPEIQIFP